jgi:hypothetical protein
MRLKSLNEYIDFTKEEKDTLVMYIDIRNEELQKIGCWQYIKFNNEMKNRLLENRPLNNSQITDLSDKVWIMEHFYNKKSKLNKSINDKIENTKFMKQQSKNYEKSEKRYRENQKKQRKNKS